MSREGISPTYLVPATVISVNSKTYRAEVALENIDGAIPDVEVASLYCHPVGGEGMYFLPEVGSTCYLFYPSDDSRPVVLGYRMPVTLGDGDAGGRLEVNPGDYVHLTRGGGKIILRREGAIEIGATSMAQRLYIPLNNFIRDIFEQYEAHSPLGDISWTREETEAGEVLSEVGMGQSRVRYRMGIKEFAEDAADAPKVTLEVGERWVLKGPLLFDDIDFLPFLPYLSFTVEHPDGQVTGNKAFELQLSAAGNLYARVEGFTFLDLHGPARVKFDNRLVLTGPAGSSLEITIDGRHIEDVTHVVVKSKLGIELRAEGGISLVTGTGGAGGYLLLGTDNLGVMQPVLLSNLLLAWLAQVQSVDGILVGPPPPPAGLLRSRSVWVKP